MTNDERVDAPAEEHLGFQLNSAETPMYSEPDRSSRVVAKLPENAVVTILERMAGFLQVVTSDDRFGYILDSTPMKPVEGRMVDGWNVQIPDLEPASEAMIAGFPSTVEPDHAPSPNVTGLEGARRRDALVFLDRLSEEDGEADRTPDNTALFSGIAAATFGMLGLLLAHAVSGLTNNELMIFFFGDVLFPLAVLTGRPNSSPAVFGLITLIYYAALFGYVGATP